MPYLSALGLLTKRHYTNPRLPYHYLCSADAGFNLLQVSQTVVFMN